LELLAQVSAQRQEWRRQPVQAIAHLAGMPSVAEETTATKNRRKVQ
jgi:hypothetical protein